MKKEVKTSIDGLDVGMFISRLDRPWIKTPYDLEGIKIVTKGDIERIRKYCNYVYVDLEQGVSPDSRYWILKDSPKRQHFGEMQQPNKQSVGNNAKNEYQALRHTTYENSSNLNVEIKTALNASKKRQMGSD